MKQVKKLTLKLYVNGELKRTVKREIKTSAYGEGHQAIVMVLPAPLVATQARRAA